MDGFERLHDALENILGIQEYEYLCQYAKEKELSEKNALRQAVRILQLVDTFNCYDLIEKQVRRGDCPLPGCVDD